jgi:hypothetical protein
MSLDQNKYDVHCYKKRINESKMWIRWGRNGACLVHVNGRNLVGHDLVEEEIVRAPAPEPSYPFRIINQNKL